MIGPERSERMEQHQGDLWVGGAWEQPSRPFTPPPTVHIPQKRKQKKWYRRPVFMFCAILALICGLTVGTVLTRGGMPWDVPGGHRSSDEQEAPQLTMPRAETGAHVTLEIAPLPEQTMTYTQVYEKNQMSVVTVHAFDETGTGQGTGIVLTQDGYIITNAHVIDGAAQVLVQLSNDISYEAALVGISPEEDLAVLKVEAMDLVPAEFGDSLELKVGQTVLALGNPLGYRMSLTHGIISAVDRQLEVDGNTMYLIQTSAPINFGNSGGALFNDRGQVIGVTAVKIVANDGSTEGLGFAIPTERVKYVAEHLIAGEELKIPMLGIEVLQTPGETGVLVKSIQPWSDAGTQGVQVGDVIVAANGYSINGNRDLERIKNLQRVGQRLLLELDRNGQRIEASVLLQESADMP